MPYFNLLNLRWRRHQALPSQSSSCTDVLCKLSSSIACSTCSNQQTMLPHLYAVPGKIHYFASWSAWDSRQEMLKRLPEAENAVHNFALFRGLLHLTTSGFLCKQLASYVKCSIIRCLIISLISGQREMALVGIATLLPMQACQVVADIDKLGNGSQSTPCCWLPNIAHKLSLQNAAHVVTSVTRQVCYVKLWRSNQDQDLCLLIL